MIVFRGEGRSLWEAPSLPSPQAFGMKGVVSVPYVSPRPAAAGWTLFRADLEVWWGPKSQRWN